MATDPAAILRVLSGWGRTAPSLARVVRPLAAAEAAAAVREAGPRGAVPRGLGRAYGDAAQNGGGLVVDCTGLAAVGAIDTRTGVVTVAGGAALDAVIRAALPAGWFLPVTPGTQHITVGGAIAADVHGKNHHRDGSFARYVSAITLLLPTGEARRVTPEGEPDLFWATAGGMGLTGVILEATLRLTRVETRFMTVDTRRTRDLDETMVAMEADDARYRYSVAWIDLVAGGGATGRGVLTRGDHAPLDALPARERGRARRYAPRPALPLPPLPGLMLSRFAVRILNALWFRRAPAARTGELQTLEAFFYRLDAVARWNRAYGARGLVQWQCALPFGEEERLRRIVGAFAAGRAPATLAVLKRFGAASPGYLSFPVPGWTLAVDLPAARGQGLEALLDGLDRSVVEGGGRIYLAKDARMRAERLPAMYPRLEAWRAVQAAVDPAGRFTSDLDRRLGLTAHAARRLGRAPRPPAGGQR